MHKTRKKICWNQTLPIDCDKKTPWNLVELCCVRFECVYNFRFTKFFVYTHFKNRYLFLTCFRLCLCLCLHLCFFSLCSGFFFSFIVAAFLIVNWLRRQKCETLKTFRLFRSQLFSNRFNEIKSDAVECESKWNKSLWNWRNTRKKIKIKSRWFCEYNSAKFVFAPMMTLWVDGFVFGETLPTVKCVSIVRYRLINLALIWFWGGNKIELCAGFKARKSGCLFNYTHFKRLRQLMPSGICLHSTCEKSHRFQRFKWCDCWIGNECYPLVWHILSLDSSITLKVAGIVSTLIARK